MESFYVIKSSGGLFYNPSLANRSYSSWSSVPGLYASLPGAEVELKNLQKLQPEFANAISIQEFRLVK